MFLLAFALLVLTTRPSDLIPVPGEEGFISAFWLCAEFGIAGYTQKKAQVGSIMDAQRSRGLETEGNLWTRLKAFLPLIGPVVMSSLLETRERAMALEVRGFSASGKKTFLYERESSTLDRVLQWTLIVVLILSIAARFYAGMKAVVVENLKYRYPSTERLALSGVSFEVEQGEFIA